MRESVDRYRIVQQLQSSDSSGTYLARDVDGAKHLLRMVSRELVSRSWLMRMEQDVNLLRQIEHPGYSRPIDCGETEDALYVLYSWIEGKPIGKQIGLMDNKEGQFDISWNCISSERLLQFAIDILEVLSEIHGLGCVHRDLRPSHILQQPDGRVVLAGTGVLCIAEAFGRSGYEASEFSTFASPELAGSIDHEIGAESDLYSLGIILYTLLAGHPPYQGKNVGELLFQHLTSIPNFDQLHDVPRLVIQFISRLIAKEPRDRYQSAVSALEDAAAILAQLQHGSRDEIILGRHDVRTELTEPTFVGRVQEMETIEKSLLSAAAGTEASMIVRSKSGMGKSRLLLESVRLATQQGFTIFRSYASDQATQQPYGPVLQIVGQFASRIQDQTSVIERVSKNLDSYRPEICVAMPRLAQTLGWGKAELKGPDAIGQSRVAKAFCQVLKQCGLGSPALIVMDDCQWIDRPSLRVLADFHRLNSRDVSMLLGARPSEGVSDELIDRLSNSVLIDFGPLDQEGITAISESMAGAVPSMILDHIFAMSQGSPFLATAAIRGLVESRAMVSAGGKWEVDQDRLSDFQAAGDSAEILVKRLALMDQKTRRLLSVGAIVGKQFDLDIPLHLSSLKSEEIVGLLRNAKSHGLVWTKPNGIVAFVHDKIREAILEALDQEEKTELHRSVGDYLLERSPECDREIAYHFDAADLPEKAWRHAVSAATHSRTGYALESAENYYQIAARALPASPLQLDGNADIEMPLDSQYEITLGLAMVLMLNGKYSETEQWLALAKELAPSDEEKLSVSFHQGELAFKRGNKEESLAHYESALRELGQTLPSGRLKVFAYLAYELCVQVNHSVRWILPRRWKPNATDRVATDRDRLMWQIYSRLAHSYWFVRDKYHTLWAHLRGMNLAERYAPTPELAQAYSEHAPVMSLIPWQSRGMQYANRSLAMREETNDLWGQGQTHNFMSCLLLACAKFEACLNQSQLATAVLQRTGDHWEMHIAGYQAAAALYRQGRLKEATNAAKSIYGSAVENGDEQTSGIILDVWARASLGQLPLEFLRRETGREIRDIQGNCQVLFAEGVQCVMNQHLKQAIFCFRKAIWLAKSTGLMNAYISPCYPWLVTALRCKLLSEPSVTARKRSSLIQQISKEASAAVKIAKRFRADLPHALRELAAAKALTGDNRDAIRLLKRSIDMAEEQGAEYELVKSQRMLAEIQWEISPTVQAKNELSDVKEKLKSIEESVLGGAESTAMSLLDRFDSLLDAGRSITLALSPTEIIRQTIESAMRLLRGERVCFVQVPQVEGQAMTSVYPVEEEFDSELASKTLATAQSTATFVDTHKKFGTAEQHRGSFLCCPITLQGEIQYLLYVTNPHIHNLYGDEDIRIANFLASMAGAALERADGIQQLETLNETLEQKVADRTAAVTEHARELERTADELRKTKQRLERAIIEAQSANSAKSDFLACMSHEIRTPMCAILGFAEILQQGELTDEEHHEYLERVHSNGEHLLNLLNDILDLSKIEANRLEIETISCMPLSIVHDAIAALSSRAAEKQIDLKINVTGVVPEFIQSDPTRIRQIVTNLVGNAIKFTEHGDVEIIVEMQHACIESGKLSIAVADTGIGIEKSKLQQIFEPFSQADRSTTREYGGSGLGLTITQRLVEALGGELIAESQVGAGSRFTATIDTGDISSVQMVDGSSAQIARNRNPQKNRVHHDLQGKNILVVDDVEANRELIGFLLKQTGAEVEFATNGREAVALFQPSRSGAPNRPQFDMVFMDMQMPEMDGYDATSHLRKHGHGLPVVALTANAMHTDRDKCQQYGCTDYLPKPIDFDMLITMAHRYTCGEGNFEESSRSSVSESASHHRPEPMPTDSEPEANRRAAPMQVKNPTTTASLDSEGLEDVMARLRIDFSEKLTVEIEKMRDALSARDGKKIGAIAHWIKGTGGSLGFTEMATISKRIEAHVRSDEFDEIGDRIVELEQENMNA